MHEYDFKKIESKWQKHWQDKGIFKADNNGLKPKYYCLDMFPYPSAAGLHVGHVEGYTATDIVARFKRMNNFNVLHPFGWDAFGLPAEQFAIQTGNNPKEFTKKNILHFKKQIQRLGKSVDWDRELATTDTNYYQWTQWIFKRLYEKGLASLKLIEVNWCEGLGTVLANDEIINIDGVMVSERSHFPVIKKPMKQWVLHITKYAERLLDDLKLVNWPENLIEMQKNWIGKSVGLTINFVTPYNVTIPVFTTRADTIFGVTYLCLAPENPLVLQVTTEDELDSVKKYIHDTAMKSDLDRQVAKEKSGIFTGGYAEHPITGEKIPIWVSDYVLPHYGTGAIMAVPAHDQRDYEFALSYDLPIKKIIVSSEECFEGDGVHCNSMFIDGLNNDAASKLVVDYIVSKDKGEQKTTYRLRDWVFSRQRYWGEPFPVYYDNKGNTYLVDDNKLPLELPYLTNIKPSGDGQSPLANAKDWVRFSIDGKNYFRDTNTMPQLAGSSWYYIGYILKNHLGMVPLNSKEAKKLLDMFLPVDLYVGGTEHAVGHLLYARFWHKFLYDLGLVSCKEPFIKLVNQGMILGADHKKMSKSTGNVVSPDELYDLYGADALRLYEMFMGPIEAEKPWSNDGIVAAKKFIDRVWRLAGFVQDENNPNLDIVINQTIKKVTEDYESLGFNTAIAQMMTFVNAVYQDQKIGKKQLRIFLQLLNPIAPHLTEQMNYECLGNNEELAYSSWPNYDDSLLADLPKKLAVQVDGRTRAVINVYSADSEDTIKARALEDLNKKGTLADKEIVKTIYVAGKILSFVTRKK